MADSSLFQAFESLESRESTMLKDLQQFLQTPGFSNSGEGVAESASLCADLLLSIGASEVELVEAGGPPVVYGTLKSSRPDAPTLLVYSLYDMVPIEGDTWRSDPTRANIVNASDIDLNPALGRVMVSRGVANQRGPMFAALNGMSALRELRGELPVNIVFCWEGEEEMGSPHLPNFVQEKRSELDACDALWVPAFAQTQGGAMGTGKGFLGLYLAELHCRGGDWGGAADGQYIGPPHVGWVDSPVIRLIHAVASMFDADHNVIVDGLAEQIPKLTEDELQMVEAYIDSMDAEAEREWMEILGVKRFRGGETMASNIHRMFDGILANVSTFSAGHQGPQYKIVSPQSACAKIDMEFPPGLEPTTVSRLLREHLDARGFNEITIENEISYPGTQLRETSDLSFAAACREAAYQHDIDVFETPWLGWACPMNAFGKLDLPIPSAWAGAGHGERMHQPDEYMTVGSVLAMAKYTVSLLDAFAKERA